MCESLDKLPGIRERGVVIGDALAALYRQKPHILDQILAAIRDKIEDLSVFDAAVGEIITCVANATGCDDAARHRTRPGL